MLMRATFAIPVCACVRHFLCVCVCEREREREREREGERGAKSCVNGARYKGAILELS